MGDMLYHRLCLCPLLRRTGDGDQHVGMLVENLLDEGDVVFWHPAALWQEDTRVGVDQDQGMVSRIIELGMRAAGERACGLVPWL